MIIALHMMSKRPGFRVALVPSAFIAPQIGDCFYSRLLQTDIIQPVLKHFQLAHAHMLSYCTMDTPNEFYKIYYLNCNCYHYRFKPIQVQRKLHKKLKGQGKDLKKSMKKKKTLGKRENKLAIHYFQQIPSSLKLVYLKLICSYFVLFFKPIL